MVISHTQVDEILIGCPAITSGAVPDSMLLQAHACFLYVMVIYMYMYMYVNPSLIPGLSPLCTSEKCVGGKDVNNVMS